MLLKDYTETYRTGVETQISEVHFDYDDEGIPLIKARFTLTSLCTGYTLAFYYDRYFALNYRNDLFLSNYSSSISELNYLRAIEKLITDAHDGSLEIRNALFSLDKFKELENAWEMCDEDPNIDALLARKKIKKQPN